MMDVETPAIKRRSAVMAGIFYPENAEGTAAAIRSFNAAPTGNAAAVLAPHAGWELAGAVEAAALASAAGRKISTVVLLGPVHDDRERGIFLSDSAIFETPLGNLAVDAEANEELESCSTLIEMNDIPHLYEHSLEILLPLVKHFFPAAAIVPILVGGARTAAATALSNALDVVFGSRTESTLFVVSSNLSEHPLKEAAHTQEDAFLSLILEGRYDELPAAVARGEISACGAMAAAALLSSRLAFSWKPRVRAEASVVSPDDGPDKIVRYTALSFE